MVEEKSDEKSKKEKRKPGDDGGYGTLTYAEFEHKEKNNKEKNHREL